MEVREIVTNWLRTHGFDGLCNDGCGCPIDDLFLCGLVPTDCETAYKESVGKDYDCSCDCSEPHEHFVSKGHKSEQATESTLDTQAGRSPQGTPST